VEFLYGKLVGDKGYIGKELFQRLFVDGIQLNTKLESEEPTHGALASLGNTIERLVDMDALILADSQRCAVNEADTCTLAQQHLLDEQGKRNGYLFLQFHETVVGDQL
jgi:hypothetical protein